MNVHFISYQIKQILDYADYVRDNEPDAVLRGELKYIIERLREQQKALEAEQ